MIKNTIIAAAVAATVGAFGMTAGTGMADAGVKIFVTPPVVVAPVPGVVIGGYWGPGFYYGPTYHARFYHNPRAPRHCHKWKNKNGVWKKNCHRHY